MKKIFLILPVVLLLAASCGKSSSTTTQTPAVSQQAGTGTQNRPDGQTQNQQQPFNLVKLVLNAQNNSAESGTASIFDVNGKAKVIINLAGAPANASQPAHVHFGSCALLGGVRYPLTNVGNGTFETVLPVSLDELVSQPFAINAHKSAAEIGVYVACGDSTKMLKSMSTDPSLGAQ